MEGSEGGVEGCEAEGGEVVKWREESDYYEGFLDVRRMTMQGLIARCRYEKLP